MPVSKYNVRYLDPGEFALWDQFVSLHPFGTLFHSTAWGELIHSAFGRSFSILTVFKKDELQGGLLFWPKKSALLDSIPLTPVTTYQGILIREPESTKQSKTIANEEEITGLLLDTLKQKYGYIELNLMRHIRDMRPYTWNGFTAQPAYSYCFAIKPFGDLRGNFSQALRRKIKLSEKEDHAVRESKDLSHLVRFVVQSYAHHRIAPPVGEKYIKKIVHAAIDGNLGKLFYLFVNDVPVAGLFLLYDAKRVYALFSGIDHESRAANYTEYLHAAVLDNELFTGKEFDFLGANTKDFEQFKRSFGGQLETYYRVRYLKNNWVRILLAMRKKQHRLKRRIPGKV